MRRETRTFLALVRDAQDPTPADEARVLLALRATLAAGAASSAVTVTLAEMRSARPSATLGALGAKGALGLACVVAASLATGDTPRTATGIGAGPGGAQADAPALSEPREPLPAWSDAAWNDAPGSAAPLREWLDAPQALAPPAAPERRETPARHALRARGSGGLRAELELLEQVQQLLRRGDAPGALRALDAHRTSAGVLLAERRAARILALCGVGRTAEARAAAAEFEREHPDSVQRAAIASSCANPRWIGAR